MLAMKRNAEQPKSGRAHWDKVPGKEGKGANEDVMIASEEPEAIFGNIPKYITRASGEPAQRVTVASVRVPVPSSFSPNSNQVKVQPITYLITLSHVCQS